jgi:molecular chaperone Hsp33
MKKNDQLLRFVFDETAVRGQLLSLDASWRQCLQNSDAGERANQLLGQALAAVTLLASTLKIKGKMILQIRGQGAVHLLVVEATHDRCVRGMVRQNRDIEDPQASLQHIFGADKIVVTIDNGNAQPYQGIVPLSGNSLASALEHYFQQSDQLPTRLWLASDDISAAGLLLQKLPDEENEKDDDSWNRVTLLADTVRDEELLKLDAPEVLHRLFHEESLRLFELEPLRFSCRCSRQRTADMIKSLGRAEAQDILGKQGRITVNCEFCNARYDFDAVDAEQIFAADNSFPAHNTKQ